MTRPPAPIRRAGTLGLALLSTGVGCHHRRPEYRQGPPVQVQTGADQPTVTKPMPPAGGEGFTPYADPPLIHQEMPEEPRYAAAYAGIGRPKIVVFVNRTVTGELLPVVPAVGVRQPGLSPDDERSVVYLQPGQYDQAQAAAIDYQLVENLLTEDLSAGGRVIIVSPTGARQRLTDADVQDVQAGRPQMLGELARKLNADVLVQVTAHPSRQTDQGLGIRLVAEAINTHGGQAIAFAAVDVPPPLARQVLNDRVRFVARKLMDGMSTAWETKQPTPPTAALVPSPMVPPSQPEPPPLNPLSPPPPITPAVVPLPTPAPPPAAPTLIPATPTTRSSANPLDLPPPP